MISILFDGGRKRNVLIILLFAGTVLSLESIISPKDDRYRPQIHFSIEKNWINDPNGMVYLDGEYHLHYQYYPYDSVWGPMHWGHAVSKDLIHWTELPIALYPDDQGQIFSGSAVADFDNSAGFKNSSNTPIVAMFTQSSFAQEQSIAYSNDKGRTFTKFSGNPVIRNSELQDFRDPKVILNNKSWVMVLAAGNKTIFYKSNNLKNWTRTGEFGVNPEQGSHDGVWECPDLLKFKVLDRTVWVLIVSINPGGPNGGSVTQYFIGDFDGEKFTTSQIEPLWLDWGADNYAGVTFFNDPHGRHVMMAWMNNWNYANEIPTIGWRGQMTLPRVLSLQIAENKLRIASTPVLETGILLRTESTMKLQSNYLLMANKVYKPSVSIENGLFHLDMIFETKKMSDDASLEICVQNDLKQEICVGFDKGQNSEIFLNRALSGSTDFDSGFGSRITAKREISSSIIKFELFLDVSAVEVFIDSGLTCLTALYYPDKVYNMLEIRHKVNGNNSSAIILNSGYVQEMNSIF